MIRRPKIKELESDLSQLRCFESPKFKLEQYQTPPRVAAEILFAIDSYGSGKYIEGKIVLDLGCGTGILGLGCARLGSSKVIGVDIDIAAVEVARQNTRDVGLSSDNVFFIDKDVRDLNSADVPWNVDFVVMNPPFGTRSEVHMDYKFVHKGLEFANRVFALHKRTTRDFWMKMDKWKVELLVPNIQFPVKQTFRFHKKHTEVISIDLLSHVRNS